MTGDSWLVTGPKSGFSQEQGVVEESSEESPSEGADPVNPVILPVGRSQRGSESASGEERSSTEVAKTVSTRKNVVMPSRSIPESRVKSCVNMGVPSATARQVSSGIMDLSKYAAATAPAS